MKQKITAVVGILSILVILIGLGEYIFGIDYTSTLAMTKATYNTASIVTLNEVIENLKDTVMVNDLNYKAEFRAIKTTVGQNNSILKQMATKQGIIIP